MTARATATPLGDGLFALHFDLINDTPAAVEVPAYEPFLDFSVHATADGAPVPVQQPALDTGVRATMIHVPDHGSTRVDTPIRLRIGAAAEAGTDGFVWTIAHPMEGLRLRVELELPPPFAGEYELSPA